MANDLAQLLEQASQQQQFQQVLMQAIGVLVHEAGGELEVPFDQVDGVTGGIKVDLDFERQQVIITTISAEDAELMHEAQTQEHR